MRRTQSSIARFKSRRKISWAKERELLLEGGKQRRMPATKASRKEHKPPTPILAQWLRLRLLTHWTRRGCIAVAKLSNLVVISYDSDGKLINVHFMFQDQIQTKSHWYMQCLSTNLACTSISFVINPLPYHSYLFSVSRVWVCVCETELVFVFCGSPLPAPRWATLLLVPNIFQILYVTQMHARSIKE